MWFRENNNVWHERKVDTAHNWRCARSLAGVRGQCVSLDFVLAETIRCNEGGMFARALAATLSHVMHVPKPSRSDGLVKVITFCIDAQLSMNMTAVVRISYGVVETVLPTLFI